MDIGLILKNRPKDLSQEQMEKLPYKRLKAYKNKLLDYRRVAEPEDMLWAKEKIDIALRLLYRDD